MNVRVLSAAMIGLATPSLGLLTLPPASAQQLFDLGVQQLQPGTIIPVQSLEGEEPQYFSPDSTHPVTLRVAQDIYDGSGQLVIPAGSEVRGRMQPAQGGARFFGTALIANGRLYSVQMSSDLIHDEKDPRHYSAEAIAEDAAIGAVGGTLLGLLTGGVSALGVIGGAGAGVAIGNVTAPQVVVLRPNQAINLTLDSPLRL
ncbi:MAG: hypothetical protein Q6L60_10315 [Thermostichus sp. HHBFW_bins_43]